MFCLSHRVYQAISLQGLVPMVAGRALRMGVRAAEAVWVEHHLEGKIVKNMLQTEDHWGAAGSVFAFLGGLAILATVVRHRSVHDEILFQRAIFLDVEGFTRQERK
jgi:hypothetical protein